MTTALFEKNRELAESPESAEVRKQPPRKPRGKGQEKPRAKTKKKTQEEAQGKQEEAQKKQEKRRARQKGIAKLLEGSLGKFAESKPELWEMRAYLMFVGLVYDRLASGDEELPTNELVTLAKVLAENRKTKARPRAGEPAAESPADVPAPALDGQTQNGPLSEAVRQVYGTNLAEAGQ